jgi:hypothetical protein
MDGVMFIGFAIETLRDEVPLDAASTPPVEAVLAAGYCHEPHPFALTGEQVAAILWKPGKIFQAGLRGTLNL